MRKQGFKYISFGLLLAGFAMVSAGIAEAASKRGVPLKLRASDKADAEVVEEVLLYENSHALVIGIDAYTNGWPRLSMAVKDAELVAEASKKKGFDVTLVLNPKSDELNRAFEEFFILKGEDPDARLFVWYAGHGHSERNEGFLVPADAPTPAKRGQFRLKSLALRRIGEFVRLAESKHAFAIFDSCFSGTVFESARALPPAAVTRATTLPVRQFLTSGDAGQTVSDNGTFRELFLRALNGEEKADANSDGYVTASEMGLFLTDRVTNLTQSKQTPRYGKLRDKDWDRGDFVFRLPVVEKPKPKQVATVTRGSGTGEAAAKLQQETVFWESIKDSGDADAYKAYLESYPTGTFAPLAKVKLRSAEKDEAAQQRAFVDERKKLEAERARLDAEAAARRKAEEEARKKAFAEERAKLAAERAKFAAEAEARRKAEEEARRKAFAEEQAKITAERERLAKEQQALAAQQKQQLAALTPNTQARDLESLLRQNPNFDGRPIWAGTKWNLKGVNGKSGTLKFDESGRKYVFDIDPESFNGFIKCEGDVDRKGNFPKLECSHSFSYDNYAGGSVFQVNFENHGAIGSDVFPNPALKEKVLASLEGKAGNSGGIAYLNPDQIRALVIDNSATFEGRKGKVEFTFEEDGDVTAKFGFGKKDYGTWTISSGRLCLKFERFGGGRRICPLLSISGDTLYTYKEEGKVNRTWDFERLPDAFTKLIAKQS